MPQSLSPPGKQVRSAAATSALEADRSRLHQARLGECIYGLRSLQSSLQGAPSPSKGTSEAAAALESDRNRLHQARLGELLHGLNEE